MLEGKDIKKILCSENQNRSKDAEDNIGLKLAYRFNKYHLYDFIRVYDNEVIIELGKENEWEFRVVFDKSEYRNGSVSQLSITIDDWRTSCDGVDEIGRYAYKLLDRGECFKALKDIDWDYFIREHVN